MSVRYYNSFQTETLLSMILWLNKKLTCTRAHDTRGIRSIFLMAMRKYIICILFLRLFFVAKHHAFSQTYTVNYETIAYILTNFVQIFISETMILNREIIFTFNDCSFRKFKINTHFESFIILISSRSSIILLFVCLKTDETWNV